MAASDSRKPDEIATIAANCIAVRVRKINRVVTRIYDQALRPLGIKVSQMNILVATGKLGVARPADLCRRLHLEASTLSRNVERMRARGWLEVVPDPDYRAQPLQLTREGRALVRRALPGWRAAQRKAHELLGAGMVDRLDRAVQRIDARVHG